MQTVCDSGHVIVVINLNCAAVGVRMTHYKRKKNAGGKKRQ